MITEKKGKFYELLDNGDPHLKGAVHVKRLIDEARKDFPKEPSLFEKLVVGTDIYLVYAGKIEAWFERWFGNVDL